MNTENTLVAAPPPRNRMALRKEMEHPETGAIASYFVPASVAVTFARGLPDQGKTDVAMAGYVSQSAYLMQKAPLLNLTFTVQELPVGDLTQFALLHAERVAEFADAVVVYEPQAEPIPVSAQDASDPTDAQPRRSDPVDRTSARRASPPSTRIPKHAKGGILPAN